MFDRRQRSFLFVPGNRPDRFERAINSGADAAILDLEDAVAPDAKLQAREAVKQWLGPERRALIRVNARNSLWFDDDALLGRLRGVAGIVLPKTERAADVIELVTRTKSRIPIYPLIESSLGIFNAMEIARAPFVRQLMFGTLDFCADMGIAPDGDELDVFRANLVLTSKVAGILPPIDGVTASIHDSALLEADTLRARRWGFDGKLCIHPSQVGIVNQGFAPTDSEVAWAKRVVDVFNSSNGAAVAIDGKMIDRPVILRAETILRAVSA